MTQATENRLREQVAELEEKIAHMQNLINWCARAASVQVIPGINASCIGGIGDKLKALDNGAKLF